MWGMTLPHDFHPWNSPCGVTSSHWMKPLLILCYGLQEKYLSHASCLGLNSAWWTWHTKDCSLNLKYWSWPIIGIWWWCKVICRFLGCANPLLRLGEFVFHLTTLSTMSLRWLIFSSICLKHQGNTPQVYLWGYFQRGLTEKGRLTLYNGWHYLWANLKKMRETEADR